MYALTKPARLLGGLTLLALCGCQTYSPYGSGYGYPPPGTYTVPHNGYAPGGTVVPNNAVPYGGGGTVTPGKSTSNDFGAPSGASTVPNSKSPTFEAKRGNSGLLPNEKPVPDPKVNDSSGFPNDPKGPAKTGGTNDSANNGPASGAFTPTSGTTKDASDGFPAGKSPFGSGAAADPSTGTSAKIKLAGSDKGDDTQEPARFQPPKSAAPITPAGTPVKSGSSTIIDPSSASKPMSSSAIGTPNPYDFDKKGYSWLRGIVNYDDRTKSWQIIYSLNGSDKYGGSLTLGDDAELKRLRNDDVVYVEGRVDDSRKTDRGKPVYQVVKLFGPLVPKSQVRATSTTRNTVATSSR